MELRSGAKWSQRLGFTAIATCFCERHTVLAKDFGATPQQGNDPAWPPPPDAAVADLAAVPPPFELPPAEPATQPVVTL